MEAWIHRGASSDLHFASTWKEVFAITARGPYPFDDAGKQALMDRVDRSIEDVEALVTAGEINSSAGELLSLDLQGLKDHIRGYRTIEQEQMGMTCYLPIYPEYPQTEILTRLSARVPLLEQLAGSEVIRREVAAKVLVQIEHDLAYVRGAVARAKDWREMNQEELCLAASWTGGGRWPLLFSEQDPNIPSFDKERQEKILSYSVTDDERDVLERTQRAVDELRARLTVGVDR